MTAQVAPARDGARGAARHQRHQRVRWRRGLAAALVAFGVSRAVFALAGVRFDAEPLHGAWQLVEFSELRDHLWRSLTHLHSQPPLFNLFVGVLGQVPEGWLGPVFHVAFLGFGAALTLCLYALLVRAGARPAWAAAITTLFVVSPSIVVFENWLQYDYPVTVLIAGAALALARHEESPEPRRAALLFAVLAALVLTRSMFHAVWFGVWVGVVVVRRRRDWRRLAAVAAVPVLAVAVVHVHRWAQWGEPAVSSSLGLSLAKITTFQLDERERRALVEDGVLSPLALIEPYRPVQEFSRAVPPSRRTGVPVLDDEFKKWSDGSLRVNYNHVDYIEISKRFMHDSLATVRRRPGAYASGVAGAFQSYFHPSSDFFAVAANRERLAGYERLYNTAVYGVTSGEGETRYPDVRRNFRAGPGRTAWTAVAAYLVAFVAGLRWLWRRRRGGEPSHVPPIVVAFLWSTALYITLVGNLLEIGENHRFRLYADPLVVVLLTALGVSWRRSRRGAHAPGLP